MKFIASFILCLFILSGCQSTNSRQSTEEETRNSVPVNRTLFTLHNIDHFSEDPYRYPRFCEAPRTICGNQVDYSTIAGKSGYFLVDPAVLFEKRKHVEPVMLTLVMDNGKRYNYKSLFGIFSGTNSPFASISYSNSNGYKPEGKSLYVFNVKNKDDDLYGRPQEGLKSIKGVCFYTRQCDTLDGDVLNGIKGYFTGNQRSGIGGTQDEMKLENGLTVWVKDGPQPDNFLTLYSEIEADQEFESIPLLGSDLIIVKREYQNTDSYDTEIGSDRKAGQSLFKNSTVFTVEGYPSFTETKLEIMKGVVERLNLQGEKLNLLLTIMLKGGVKYDDYEDFYIIHDGAYIDNVTLYFELSDSLSGLKGAFRTNSFRPEYALQCGKEIEQQAFESTADLYVQVFDVVERNRHNIERIISDNCGIRLKEYDTVTLVPNSKKEMFTLMLDFNDLYFAKH